MRLGVRERLETIGATAALTSAAWVVGLVFWAHGAPIDLAPHTDKPGVAQAVALGSGTAPVAMVAAVEADSHGDESAPISAAAVPLIVPVQGVRADQLTDTYTQSRGGGMRVHNAIDIMAPRGTPVLAAAAGMVEKLFLSRNGGNTIYVRSFDRRTMHYYAHLDRYAPGLAEKRAVRQGEVIGFVGSTGDANPEAPHLHFAINVMRPEEGWWQGQPINPYPLLRR